MLSLSNRRSVIIALMFVTPIMAQAPPGVTMSGAVGKITWIRLPGTDLSMSAGSGGGVCLAGDIAPPNHIAAYAKPDGTILWQNNLGDDRIPFSNPLFVASSGANCIVADGFGALEIFDGAGKVVTLTTYPNTSRIDALTSGLDGNLYIAGHNFLDNSMFVIRADETGGTLASFIVPGTSNNEVRGIASDASGAIYITGQTVGATFPVTPGAYGSTGGNPPPGTPFMSQGFIVKVAPSFDRVIYAALLGASSYITATAVAVDDSGNTYVTGTVYTDGYPDPFGMRRTVPQLPDAYSVAYLLRLNAAGTALDYATGLGDGEGRAIAVEPDGRARALVFDDRFNTRLGLFTLHPDTGVLMSARSLAWVDGSVSILPGMGGPVRVVARISSSSFPALENERLPPTPVLFTIPDESSSKLQVTARQTQPAAPFSLVPVLVTIHNNGPADALDVLVAPVPDPKCKETVDSIGCLPGGDVICQAGSGLGNGFGRFWSAKIPHLARGESTSVTFQYQIQFCPPGAVSTVAVFSLSPDDSVTAHFTTFKTSVADGQSAAIFTDPQGLEYWRSDFPGHCSQDCNRIGTALPQVTISVPTPQYRWGNWWTFDGWEDGKTDNPRTFDSVNGILNTLGSVIRFRPQDPIDIDPPSLDFVTFPGKSTSTVEFMISDASGRGRAWTIDPPSAPWLSVDDLSGNSGSVVDARANAAGMAPGILTTSLRVTINGGSAHMSVPVSLRVAGEIPTLADSGVVDGASYRGIVSSGALVSVFGTGLGPETPVVARIPMAGKLPLVLGGTSLLMDGGKVSLLYVQSQQIVGIMDGYCAQSCQATVQLGGNAAVTSVVQESSAPSLLSSDASGKGNAAAVNQDGSPNSPARPARRGSQVLLYVTGLTSQSGSTPPGCEQSADILSPGSSYDLSFGSNSLTWMSPPEVIIGGSAAHVLYAGSVPGMLCAVQQINVLIPSDATRGPAVPVSLRVPLRYWQLPSDFSWFTSQDGITLAIE